MSIAKIEIRIGEISFSGEAESDWLEKQLNKILDKAEVLSKISRDLKKENEAQDHKATHSHKGTAAASQPLASFLKSKDATTKQVVKFLATSIWLEIKGKERLKTADVTEALRDNKQSKLGNPADCLNQNITKGFCEKDGSEYFITDEGRKSLGL